MAAYLPFFGAKRRAGPLSRGLARFVKRFSGLSCHVKWIFRRKVIRGGKAPPVSVSKTSWRTGGCLLRLAPRLKFSIWAVAVSIKAKLQNPAASVSLATLSNFCSGEWDFTTQKSPRPDIQEAILPVFRIVKTGWLENLKGFQPAVGYDESAKGFPPSRALWRGLTACLAGKALRRSSQTGIVSNSQTGWTSGEAGVRFARNLNIQSDPVYAKRQERPGTRRFPKAAAELRA